METKLLVFGHNGYGRLGLGDVGNHRANPTELVHEGTIEKIACGAGHNLMITDEGVWSWGKCHFGQLGHGHEDKDEYKPVLINPLDFGNDIRITQISCGDSHCLAISQNGQLWTWGGGFYGPLGHGDESHQFKPKRVEFFTDKMVSQADGGSAHSIVLTSTGQVYTFGKGTEFQLGHGTKMSQRLPKLVEAIKDIKFKKVGARGPNTCALSEEGQVYVWGESLPKLLETRSMKDLCCGNEHVLAIDDDGRLYSWGNGEFGRLGRADAPDIVSHVSLVEKVVLMSAANTHNVVATGKQLSDEIVIIDDNSIYTFGSSEFGKLGNGILEKHTQETPYKLSVTPTLVVQVASAAVHTMVLIKMLKEYSARLVYTDRIYQ